MSGERKNISTRSKYGTLNMRPYVIFGNDIVAFYDKSDDLVFVLDNTLNSRKPNVLLVMNPDGDKKWDEILSDDYMVDLEYVRPKQDNKYQKLDIEYSGLAVYENLINAYNADEDLTDYLAQLDVLRDSAARHSAIIRLNAANEIIAKANNTIIKTKETISDLQTRLKTLRAKLSAFRKEIGKVSTKQSAAKILRTESQIEATSEKLKRAKKRLESAQRRLDAATIDAELASDLLNQPMPEVKHPTPKTKSVVVAPKYEVQTTEPETVVEESEPDEEEFSEDIKEDFDESDSNVKPLFDTDPNILDEDIAFKPITFDAPTVPVEPQEVIETVNETVEEPAVEEIPENIDFEPVPVLNADALLSIKSEPESVLESIKPIEQEELSTESKSVLDSITPITQFEPEYSEEIKETENIEPVSDFVAPALSDSIHIEPENHVDESSVVQPAINTFNAPVASVEESKKSKFVYYLLLVFLILISVFTLWLYQKNMGNTTPVLTSKTSETVVAEQISEQPTVQPIEPTEEIPDFIEETVFLDEPAEPETKVETVVEESVVVSEEPVVEDEPVIEDYVETVPEIIEEEPVATEEPIVEDEPVVEEEPEVVETVEEPVVDKPEYDAGSKHENMFVIEEEQPSESNEEFVEDIYGEDDVFYDAEEAEYQAEQAELE